MAHKKSPVGYKRPPVESRFQKGRSGNPRGRPKKVPDFFEDAATILSTPVTGHANGEKITLPMAQAMFRGICRKALKGDNAALRRVVDLMLTLEPAVRHQAKQDAKAEFNAKRELSKKLGLNPNAIDDDPKEPDPEMDELWKQADAMAKEERKRLIREARRRQQLL